MYENKIGLGNDALPTYEKLKFQRSDGDYVEFEQTDAGYVDFGRNDGGYVVVTETLQLQCKY